MAQDPASVVPVPVGGGSLASAPLSSYSEELNKFLARKPNVHESFADRPTPTNHWWTHLLVTDDYPGQLWAYPLVGSADAKGPKVFLPIKFTDDGCHMITEAPISLLATESAAARGDQLIADFESESWPPGWTTEGDAWGPGPCAGTATGQSMVNGFLGNRLANSFSAGGDGPTGKLTSPPFNLSKRYLHVLVAGGSDSSILHLDLIVDGRVARTASGQNSEQLNWTTWDLQDLIGRSAQLQGVDDSSGGWGHLMFDHVLLSDRESPPGGGQGLFPPGSVKTMRWGDWDVMYRMTSGGSPDSYVDVTVCRGSPYMWVESKGLDLAIEGQPDDVITGLDGNPLALPAQVDSVVVDRSGRRFALFCSPGATWLGGSSGLQVSWAAGTTGGALVIAGVSEGAPVAKLKQHAFAIPRDTRISWSHDKQAGVVRTTMEMTAEAIVEGASNIPIQGFLPHHWRGAKNPPPLIDGFAYTTPRGKVRLAEGASFNLDYEFQGLVPWFPLSPNADRDRLAQLVDRFLANKYNEKDPARRLGTDTYWGGKQLVLTGQYMCFARALGADMAEPIRAMLRAAMEDWLTYTPGEPARFFARYPPHWPGIIGFNDSYGSAMFTDNHFHYGYFTYAAALLGSMDSEFTERFGPMMTLVAKEYANWDRNDKDFPFMRTFDVWAGHNCAGGTSSVVGNNQESTSESMQSWGGLFLLGELLGNAEMSAAGAMGWAIEAQAAFEYWFDYHGWKDKQLPENERKGDSNWPVAYGHSLVGILGDGGNAFGTFFGGNPAYIYGIQWLPLSPVQNHLARDPEFAKYQSWQMITEQITWATRVIAEAEAKNEKPCTTPFHSEEDMDSDWGNVWLGNLLYGDPDYVLNKLNNAWSTGNDFATIEQSATTYQQALARRGLGHVAWDFHSDVSTSIIFRSTDDGSISAVVWNPTSSDLTATVFAQDGSQVGTVSVAPKGLAVHRLTNGATGPLPDWKTGTEPGLVSGGTVDWSKSAPAPLDLGTLGNGGHFRMICQGSGKALSVVGNAVNDGANVVQGSWCAHDSQRWKFLPLMDGWYTVVNKHSGKAMDVIGGLPTPGANIDIWESNQSNAQKWKVEEASPGWYKLIPCCSGHSMSVQENFVFGGANVQQEDYKGEPGQHWAIEPAD